MLRFFSKIRYQLAAQNRAAKYLRYAIGEILLVVFGILIALQVNNWNGNRLAKIEEKKVLRNLIEEFEENNRDLNQELELLDKQIYDCSVLYYQFDRIIQLFTERQVDSLLEKVSENPVWYPSNFILNELKSSEQQSGLNNVNLKKLLYSFARNYDRYLRLEDSHQSAYMKYLTFINENGSQKNIDRMGEFIDDIPTKMKASNLNLFYEFRFENYLNDRFIYLKIRRKFYLEFIDIIDNILIETKKELRESN